jgi:hypothetical protein
VLIAATKSEALDSWASAALFGVVMILFGLTQRFITPLTNSFGRRFSPGPLKRLFPEGTTQDKAIRLQRRACILVGAVFLTVGAVGFFVRLALPS